MYPKVSADRHDIIDLQRSSLNIKTLLESYFVFPEYREIRRLIFNINNEQEKQIIQKQNSELYY